MDPGGVACPTCGARFRGEARCGRCGTDLQRLMAVARQAHALREEARLALLADRPAAALDVLDRARQIHDTPSARRLLVLALLAADRPRLGVALAARLVAGGDRLGPGPSRPVDPGAGAAPAVRGHRDRGGGR